MEIVIGVGVNPDVHRFGMADDRQAKILAGEHLFDPLCPFQIGDLSLNPDLAQLTGDNLAAAPGIGWWGQFQSSGKPISKARVGQQIAGAIRVMG